MKKLTIAALTVGTLLSYSPFSPVAHATPSPSGKLCTLTSGGGMEGGPLVLGDDTIPTIVHSGSMTCTVQSGTNDLYSETDADSETGPVTTGTASIAGTVTVPATRPLYICTSVTIIGSGTLNYDYPSGTWVAAPGGACAELPWEPFGLLCGFTSTTDPTGDDNTQSGTVDGGPLVITDEYHVPPPSASLTCTIRIGAQSFTVTGPTTPGVVVVPATQISFEASENETVSVCSQINFEGGDTLYWHVDGWSTSPPADCVQTISTSTPGDDEFPFDVLLPILCSAADLLPEPVRTLLEDLIGCPAH